MVIKNIDITVHFCFLIVFFNSIWFNFVFRSLNRCKYAFWNVFYVGFYF